MTWAVTAATVGSIGGSLLGDASARKQARAKAEALAKARSEVTQAYQTSKGYYDPFYSAGQEGLNALRSLMEYKPMTTADFQADPGYQFRLKESLKEILRGRAARGGTLSGATVKSVGQQVSDYASNEFQNAFARRLQERQEALRVPTYLTGVGYQTAGNLADLSTNYGANMANFAMGAGAIDAAKTASQYGMYGDILGSGANFLGAVKGAGGFKNFFGGGTGGGQYGLGSTQAQLGYENARIDPTTNQLRIDF